METILKCSIVLFCAGLFPFYGSPLEKEEVQLTTQILIANTGKRQGACHQAVNGTAAGLGQWLHPLTYHGLCVTCTAVVLTSLRVCPVF